jgi:hypothetical protein
MGVALTIVFFVIYEVVSMIIRRRAQREHMQDDDMFRYRNCNAEEGWVGMLDICREIILMDTRMFEKLAGLIGSYPLMSHEKLKDEFKYSANLEKALLERVADRYTMIEILENAVARDSMKIAAEKEQLEQKWPEATADYTNYINAMTHTKDTSS